MLGERISSRVRWTAVVVLAMGAILVTGGWEQRTPQLRRDLGEVVPDRFGEYVGEDVVISEREREVAGFTDYLMRIYEPGSSAADEEVTPGVPGVPDGRHWISTYVGYYDTQARGRTIHSPKNCLPGSGWEALESTRATVTVPDGRTVEVNRYLLQRDSGERALVLYWYQGRGRVVASEYRAKWDLLRDATLQRRSEEALVRIVVPVVDSEESAFDLARSVAQTLLPSVDRALPAA